MIDGLPQRQLTAYRDQLGPDGFNRFLERGAWFADAHFGHANTLTGPGHATVLTGAYPHATGIIGNEWRDPATGAPVYCAGDPAHGYLGHARARAEGTSPRNLLVESLGDVLRRTDPRSKVLAVSGKDRGAILPAGRDGTAYMYMAQSGEFASTTYYMPEHPPWVAAFNRAKPADRYFRKEWAPLLPEMAYARSVPDARAWFGRGGKLPMVMGEGLEAPGPMYYGSLYASPFLDALMFDFARAAVAGESLGQDEAPDILALSLSGHDYVNHAWGAESRLSHDHVLQVDQLLAGFFRDLDGKVGKDNYVVVLTADHGFMPVPEHAVSQGHDAGRLNPGAALAVLEEGLAKSFGAGPWVRGWSANAVLLDRARIARVRSGCARDRPRGEAHPPGTARRRGGLHPRRDPRDRYWGRFRRTVPDPRSGAQGLESRALRRRAGRDAAGLDAVLLSQRDDARLAASLRHPRAHRLLRAALGEARAPGWARGGGRHRTHPRAHPRHRSAFVQRRPIPAARALTRVTHGEADARMTDRLEAWFAANGWRAFDYQREVWAAYLAGESGLIHSATGSGKTLAAFLGPLAESLAEDDGKAPPIRVLWLTPMRALAGDTVQSLQKAVAGLELGWTVGIRTGDTTAAERAKQARKLPTALVTTPESLSLMLSQADAREKLSTLRAVIVDEWHELLGNKRGVQVELALARLRRWNPRLRTWGLSATLGNLDEALDRLLAGNPGRVVRGVSDKRVVIDTLIPAEVDRFPWAGHLGLVMLEDVIGVLESSRSTLVFTNTRSQAEIWYQALIEARPDWAGLVALHHGSLDADVRRWVEQGLKEGRLKAVVATSSLDLGVDFSPVERVLQIGSPKGVARLLQRAGRSGHAPGQVSRVTCVPSHALEFVEAAAARRAANARRIESRRPVEKPLDLLVQHLVTIAVGEGFIEEELKAEVKSARAFRDLTDEEWRWAMDFVTRGGESLKAYPEYHRVEEVDGWNVVRDAAIARRHRMSVGTIVSDASMDVRYLNGKRLGHVEESFIAWLSPGDAFVFGGHALEFIRVENMTALVRPAKRGATVVPRWQGGRSPLSSEVSESVRELLEAHLEGRADEPEMRAVARLLALQRSWSRIPRRQELLVEQCETREGHHIFCYPFEGRHVHVGLVRARGVAPRADAAGVLLARLQRLWLRAPLARTLRTAAAPQGRAPRAGQPPRRRAREPQCGGALQAPVPRDRARRRPRVPGLPRAAEDQPAGAGHQRPHLRGVRALGCGQSAAGAGRARGAGARARVLAPGRGAAAARGCADRAARNAASQPVRVSAARRAAARGTHQREARRPRAPHAARLRSCFRKRGREHAVGVVLVTECTVAGERLVLLPERAAWWPAAATLFVADFHLGKAASFRHAGIPMPAGTTTENVERLQRAVAAAGARHVVFLGDFLHSAEGRAQRTLDRFAAWRAAHGEIAITLVRGNHDDRAGDPPAEWAMRCVDPGERLGPFALVHDPQPVRGAYALAGHIHPAVRLSERGGQAAAPAVLLVRRARGRPAFLRRLHRLRARASAHRRPGLRRRRRRGHEGRLGTRYMYLVPVPGTGGQRSGGRISPTRGRKTPLRRSSKKCASVRRTLAKASSSQGMSRSSTSFTSRLSMPGEKSRSSSRARKIT